MGQIIRNKYQEDEDAKETLKRRPLTPEQYEQALKQLAEELGI